MCSSCDRFYRSQFWRLQKPSCGSPCSFNCFIGHNFGDYKNTVSMFMDWFKVLSVTILETTKTYLFGYYLNLLFYRSQFWRLQKLIGLLYNHVECFIGHNFGDYKNLKRIVTSLIQVLSVTILETTKTRYNDGWYKLLFYRSQFWRLQKRIGYDPSPLEGFIGHNFGDYKN